MGNPSWTKDEGFSTHVLRYQNHDDFDRLFEAWTLTYDNFELFHVLQQEGVPAGPVYDEKATYNDPQLNARGFFKTINHPDVGTYRYPGFLWNMSKTPPTVDRPPCRLGEHNAYVFRDVLGMPEKEIERLEEAKIIGGDRYIWA